MSKDERPLRDRIRVPQTATTGAAAIFGKWPGDETDEEFEEMIKDMENPFRKRDDEDELWAGFIWDMTWAWRYEAVVIALAKIVDAAVVLGSATFLAAGLNLRAIDWANDRCSARAKMDDDHEIYMATIAGEDETNDERLHREMIEDSGLREHQEGYL